MRSFRLNWTRSLLRSREFRAQLRREVTNPTAFYLAIALKMAPGLYRRSITIRLRTGHTVPIPSFMSLYIFKEIFLDKVYDIDAVSVQSVIDIGANTGQFTLRAKELWPEAEVVAFEPEPANYASLRDLIAQNGLEKVTPINAAISATRGTIKLWQDPKNVGGHSIVKRVGRRAIEVPTQTLAGAFARLTRGSCDVLKLDCEGAEEAILRALVPEVAAKIGTVVYEPEPSLYSVPDLNAWLEELGFTIECQGGLVIARRVTTARRRGSSDPLPSAP